MELLKFDIKLSIVTLIVVFIFETLAKYGFISDKLFNLFGWLVLIISVGTTTWFTHKIFPGKTLINFFIFPLVFAVIAFIALQIAFSIGFASTFFQS